MLLLTFLSTLPAPFYALYVYLQFYFMYICCFLAILQSVDYTWNKHSFGAGADP